jgi:DNA-binding transcriptional LysR family regulator
MQHKKHGAQFYGKPLVFLLRLMFSDSMARRIPPLNALRAFEAAARSGGFAAAANELGVTPGAISRHVRLLEDRTGHTLFERHPRSLVLTPRGHDLLAVVSEALDRLEAGTQAALSPAPRAKLSLNVQTSLAIGWMLPRLARLHRDRTDLELELSTHIETPDLRARKADAAIVHGRGPWPELEAHFLFADRLQPVCSPGYLAARRGRALCSPRHCSSRAPRRTTGPSGLPMRGCVARGHAGRWCSAPRCCRRRPRCTGWVSRWWTSRWCATNWMRADW